MKQLSLVLLCLLVVSCGSTKALLDKTLIATEKTASEGTKALKEVSKVSKVLREDTLPAIKTAVKSLANTSDIRKKLSTNSNTFNMLMWVGVALGAVLLILVVVIIHHKLTSGKRHEKQLDHMLCNGGGDKILKAIEPKLVAEFVAKNE